MIEIDDLRQDDWECRYGDVGIHPRVVVALTFAVQEEFSAQPVAGATVWDRCGGCGSLNVGGEFIVSRIGGCGRILELQVHLFTSCRRRNHIWEDQGRADFEVLTVGGYIGERGSTASSRLCGPGSGGKVGLYVDTFDTLLGDGYVECQCELLDVCQPIDYRTGGAE